MKVLGNGYFSDEWNSTDLSKGISSIESPIRNQKILVDCQGMIGKDGLLSSIPSLELSQYFSDDLIIKGDFPFPQIFTTEKLIIICNRDSILEIHNDRVVKKFIAIPGSLWDIASFYDFVYLSNGMISVVRDPLRGNYDYTNAPICEAICNYNGQVICGNITDTHIIYNGQFLHNGLIEY